jgi:uncharacterized protein (TIGR00645 family)
MPDTSPQPPRAEDDLVDRVRRNMGRAMLAVRWLVAPLYIGLIGALVLDAIKFAQKLVASFRKVFEMDDSETILTALTLIDLVLVANLVVIVMFAGWETFVGPLFAGKASGQLTGLGFSAVKFKLLGSIVAIASIQLLETFIHIEAVNKVDAALQLAILLGIGAVGVLLALVDRLAGQDH